MYASTCFGLIGDDDVCPGTLDCYAQPNKKKRHDLHWQWALEYATVGNFYGLVSVFFFDWNRWIHIVIKRTCHLFHSPPLLLHRHQKSATEFVLLKCAGVIILIWPKKQSPNPKPNNLKCIASQVQFNSSTLYSWIHLPEKIILTVAISIYQLWQLWRPINSGTLVFFAYFLIGLEINWLLWTRNFF